MRALLFGMALVWAAVARAVIVVPDDHPTIQAAVDAAAASETAIGYEGWMRLRQGRRQPAASTDYSRVLAMNQYNSP